MNTFPPESNWVPSFSFSLGACTTGLRDFHDGIMFSTLKDSQGKVFCYPSVPAFEKRKAHSIKCQVPVTLQNPQLEREISSTQKRKKTNGEFCKMKKTVLWPLKRNIPMFGFTSHYHPHQWHQQIKMISNRKTHRKKPIPQAEIWRFSLERFIVQHQVDRVGKVKNHNSWPMPSLWASTKHYFKYI